MKKQAKGKKSLGRALAIQAMRLMLLTSLAAATAGCSALGGAVVKAIAPSSGISADVQVGKENTRTAQAVAVQDIVEVKDNSGETVVVKGAVAAKKVSKASAPTSKAIVSGNTASVASDLVGKISTGDGLAQDNQIGSGSTVVVNQNAGYPLWLLLLLVIGWVLPTPVSMINWVYYKFKGENLEDPKKPDDIEEPTEWYSNGKVRQIEG